MFALPDGLARAGVTLRDAGAGDRAFFRALFATARVDAPILAQWPARERDVFLDSQFDFQDRHFRAAYAGADFLVVERHGKAAGRLILARGNEDWCIVDIALVPELRGQGVGAALLRAIQDAAKEAGAAQVTLHVEVGNRARGLYDRLGFTETEDIGSHIAMAWREA